MHPTKFRSLLLSAAVLALACLSPRAQAVPYDVNLLVNGNAESGASSATGAPVVVPNWTTSSFFTVIPYGAAGGYPASGDPGPPDRANQFFGGGNAAVSTATQEIDLTANATDINLGNVIFDLRGYFGGFQFDNDNARLSATFFNGTTSLGVATIGHVTAKDRSNNTALLFRCGSGAVPPNTTRVVLTQTMTRISGTSDDGYADSLSFIVSLKAGSTTTAETFAGNGTRADATGPWSDAAHWSGNQVPNNCGNNFFDVTISGLTLTDTLSNENRTIGRHFGAVNLDMSATVSNLTLTDAGLIIDGFMVGRANLLTVTGTTTDLSLQNQTPDITTETPGFTVQTQTNGADAILSLGHFANFSGTTLSSTRLTLFAQGPAATVQFTGADIVTLGASASVSLVGQNAHIIDEIGNDALRNLAVIDSGAALSIGALDFVTAGDLTINGSLNLDDNGLDTSFTVNGSLTNFNPATKTLTGGSIAVHDDISGTANVILRFNGADIVNNASSIDLSTATAKIVDENGLDALRNLSDNLAAGALGFTDRNFSTAGAFTNDGSLSLIAQGLPTAFTVNGALTNFNPATKTLTGGVYRLFGSFSTPSATATLQFNGADIVHNAADITLGSGATIINQASNDGLRNFVDNTSSGSFSLDGHSFTAPSDFTNAGAIFISNFDPSQLFSVAGGHSYTQTGGETSLGDSVLTAANVVIQGGIIHDGGTINGNVNVQGGTIAPTGFGGGGTANLGGFIIVVPGSTAIPGPDNMTINGNLALAPAAHLSFVIRNTPAGEFDTMDVSGSAAFGGTLEVTLINGFTPQAGDSFTVLSAGSPITGAFSNVANGSRITTTDGGGSFIATYANNHLVLSNFVLAGMLPPTIGKSFGAASIPLGGATSLTFTLTNPDPSTLTGVGFTDNLPAGLVVATPNGLSGSCGGGTITAVAGSGAVTLSGASLAGNASCVFSVNVTGTTAGVKNNSTTAVTSVEGGSGSTASASVTVNPAIAPPTIAKAFGAANVVLGSSTSLTFNLTNPNAGTSLTGVGFTDNLPAGLVVSTPNGLSGSCGGGTITAVAGSNTVTLATATLPASGSCSFSVNVTGATVGVKNNTTTAVTSTEGGNGGTAAASVTVAGIGPPTLSTSFGAASITVGGSTSLSFTVTNPNAATTLTGVGFTDNLPAGMVVSTPNGLAGSCGGGTIVATPASGSITLSGATLAPNSSCHFSVNVTSTARGANRNTTSAVTSVEGGPGSAASATLLVGVIVPVPTLHQSALWLLVLLMLLVAARAQSRPRKND